MRRLFQFFLSLGLMLCTTFSPIFTQSDSHVTTVSAKGTGRTTGHIITLTVENHSGQSILTRAQTIYFNSHGRYQSYVGQIPEGIVIAPGQRLAVPIYGYCVEVNKPPVPDGHAIENLDDAIEVAHTNGINLTALEDPIVLDSLMDKSSKNIPFIRVLDTKVLPQFTAQMIPSLTVESDHKDSLKVDQDLVLTFPGTNIRVPNKINVEELPVVAIPLIVEMVIDISHAVGVVTEDSRFPTPFDYDPIKKVHGQGQQTTWVATSHLSGINYCKEEFKDKTYEQFENNTGTDPKTLAPEHKQQLDGGINQFWISFTAVGLEAKVFAHPSETVAYVPGPEIEEGPVFQERPCEWKKICIEFFIVGQKVGEEVDLGAARYRYQGQLRVRSIQQDASEFALAGDALSIIGHEGMAGVLRDNIQTVLAKVNKTYEPCCIWFELNQVYGVNPEKAIVGNDGTTLQSWIQPGEFDEFGDISSQRVIEEDSKQVDGDDMNFNKAAENFLSKHSDVRSQCLKVFVAPGIKIPGVEKAGGRAQTGGDHIFLSQIRLSPDDPGLGLAHEIGHTLGLDHVEGGVDKDKKANIMIGKIPSAGHDLQGVNPLVDSKEQCDKMGARAAALGVNQRPRPRATRSNPNSGSREGTIKEEPAHDSQRQPVPPPQNDDKEIQDQDEEEEKCVCPDPEIKIEGQNDLNNINSTSAPKPVLAQTIFSTCCADIMLRATAEKIGQNQYNVSWGLLYRITDEDCFVDLKINQFYNSKRYKYFVRNANTERIKTNFTKLVFEEVRDGIIRVDPAQKLYGLDGSEETNENNGESRGNLIIDPEGDHSLNTIPSCDKWSIFLGGTITCKNGDDIKEFPFYLLFVKERGAHPFIKGSSGNIETNDDKKFIGGTISSGNLYDHPD